MTAYSIDSLPEPGLSSFTRLIVDADDPAQPPRIVFQYSSDGGAPQQIFGGRIPSLFRIRFRKYKLDDKRMYWGYLEFAPSERPVVTHEPNIPRIVLEYTGVPGRVDTNDQRPEDVPSAVLNLPAMPDIDTIRVTITIRPSTGSNAGWFDFNLSHSDPQQIHKRKDLFAWEETLLFPRFDFAAVPNRSALQPIAEGDLNFSAVWYPTAQATPSAAGVAVLVEDTLGHQTSAEYDKEKFTFTQVLRNSMHFLGGQFARPDGYVLSSGDAYGFGGNQLRYRVRAFRQKPACEGAPVSWHDVAAIYRNWLRMRYAAPGETYYRKYRARPLNAPVDRMSPHTVIMNWGLDGATPNGTPLSGVLEMHPARREHATNGRLSFAMLAERLRDRNNAPPIFEAQLWCIEMAGVYQFLGGYPHLTDVMRGTGTFKIGVGQLAAVQNMKTVTTITTDPLSLNFDRKRFAGPIRWKGGEWTDARLQNFRNWEVMIPNAFPDRVVNATRARTTTTIGQKTFQRVWLVDKIPAATEAARASAAQKRDEYQPLARPPVIVSGLYRASSKQICPTEDIVKLYVHEWVVPHILAHGARIVEFMKHNRHFCYDAAHSHIPGAENNLYDNVIGHGSWYMRRLDAMFRELHAVGANYDADPVCSFRVAHEFTPPQPLVQYVDQYYTGSELVTFLYSHLATSMITPGRDGGGVHPGYREVPLPNAAPPDFMLAAARDEDEQPDTEEKLQASFNRWRNQCVQYFTQNFKVADWGVAPRMLPTGPARAGAPLIPWDETNPLARTNPPTYTYSRCAQQTFNLRANIFENASAAVSGMRLMIPSDWIEGPSLYNAPALDHALLGSRLQRDYAEFFRHGRLLGETNLPTRVLHAWRCNFRSFGDVKPLFDFIGADDELGDEWRTKPLRDFISNAWDERSDDTVIALSLQIVHRIWVDEAGTRVLYAFANTGNSSATFDFLYGRGLEGTSVSNKRKRTIRIVGGQASSSVEVWAGEWERAMTMAPRSFAAVIVEPI